MREKHPLHGGNINEEARRIGVGVDQLLDASASLVPFALPQTLQTCLVQAVTSKALKHYPDCSHKNLKEAIANWHKIDPAMVLPGNGASELFTWAARDAATHGISALPSPGFSDYSRALRCWNAPYIHISLPLTWTAQGPQTFPISPKTNVLWITNPHNPTGQLWSRDSIEPLLEKHNLIICDEAFLPLVPNGEKQSLLPLTLNHHNLIIIRSLTKLFSIAGLRLGYAVGTPERLRCWSEYRDPWPLNSLAIEVGTEIMSNMTTLKDWIKKVQQWVSIEGPWLQNELQMIPGIHPLPSATNFQLIKGESSLVQVRESCAKKHVLLRECHSFKELGENYLRISLQNRLNNQRVVDVLSEFLS